MLVCLGLSVCLPVCLSVCLFAFVFALYALGSTFLDVKLRSCLHFTLYICVCVYVVSPLPHLSRKGGGGVRVEKRQHVGEQVYSKWHQKYLRFIMTTDISLFDICVGCPALKSARQLIPSPLPLCLFCSLCCCCCCLIRFN